MRAINTLVADIYTVLEKGTAKIDAIKLANMIKARLEENKSSTTDVLRMSKLGEKCARKLWTAANKPETAERLPGHTLLKFLIGDIHEEVVLSLAEASGHKVEARQETVTLNGVTGHLDAVIDGVLVDVKSANSRGMHKFKDHKLESDDPFGYMDQLGAYAEASKDDPRVQVKGEVAFLASDKELGHLVLDKYKKPEKDWLKVITRLRGILAEKDPPKRHYMAQPDGSSGNMKLPMECTYCQYKTECWKNANNGRGLRKFLYSSGPRWLTHVEREPREGLEVPNVQGMQETIQDTQLGQGSARAPEEGQ